MRQFINKIKVTASVIAVAACSVLATSCDKDGDLITMGKGSEVILSGSNTPVLAVDKNAGLAMSLLWTDNSKVQTSDPEVLVQKYALKNAIQISKTPDFANCYTETMNDGVFDRQYTHYQLNGILSNLGMEAGKEYPVYVRIATTSGENLEPQYSNVKEFKVIPYKIDYMLAHVLNGDGSDSGTTLASPTENGVYTGFQGVGGWYNWWLLEADNTQWGNLNVDGKPFYAMKQSEGAWNFWYPEPAGCYYTVVDTKTKQWIATYLSEVTVAGGVSGEMKYNRSENKWSYTYEATSTDPVTLTFAAKGQEYDYNTGTGSYNTVNLNFTADAVSATETAKGFTVAAPKVGECTVVLDLSDPLAVKCTIEEGGSGEEEKVSEYLWVLGNDDTYNHDHVLFLSDETTKTYKGAVSFYGNKWGYYFTLTGSSDDWTQVAQDPDDSNGKLKIGGTAITPPAEGIYVVGASLGWMSYWYEMDGAPVTSVYVTGVSDTWGLTEMTPTAERGVYTVSVTANGPTPWGLKFLINGSWDYYFGTKADGQARFNSVDSAQPDGLGETGTYTVTVDILKGTYSIE